MTEERAEYTVSGLRIENELLRERVEALRKTVDGFSDADNHHWDSQNRRIAELESTVARLEQDNRRLRHLDAMPVDAMYRHYISSEYDGRSVSPPQYDEDSAVIREWITSRDGAA